jgi:hypothetical protein
MATPLTELPLASLLAASIERARADRDSADPRDKRELALVVTNLEQAGLWLCESRAREHLGEQALLDWLLEIS